MAIPRECWRLSTASSGLSNAVQVIAGNIATTERSAGADRRRRGMRSRSVSVPVRFAPTRIVAGRRRAATDCDHGRGRGPRRKADVPVIADGGIKFSGDLAKSSRRRRRHRDGRLPAGRHRRDAGAKYFLWQGRSYKAYRGMGSVGAMARGSADRYFQQDIKDTLKLVPEGIEGQVPYKGPVGKRHASACRRLAGGDGICRREEPRRVFMTKRNSCASPARACAKATSTTSPLRAKARIIPAGA